jgi:hypothetical protein
MEADIEGLGDRYQRAAVPGELLLDGDADEALARSEAPMPGARISDPSQDSFRFSFGEICGAPPDCPGTSTESVWYVRFRSLWADLVVTAALRIDGRHWPASGAGASRLRDVATEVGIPNLGAVEELRGGIM